MAAPKVQALSQILAELEPAYAASRGLYNTQMAQLPQFEAAGLQQLEGAKTNEFRDIARSANTRGLDFWGVPIEEQATYLGEHFLPGVTSLKQNTLQGMNQLQLALAGLESDKYKMGLQTRQGQQSALDQFLEAERARAHEAQLQRERIAAENARAAAARAADTQINPQKQFLDYIAAQFQKAGGQGNPNVTRQQQDQWAEAFFNTYGVNNQNRQLYWDLFNQTYNRAGNYWEDWRYRR
jgi:hypothetical protein